MNQSIISIRRAIRKDFKRLNAQTLDQLQLLTMVETEKAYKERFEKMGKRWGNMVFNTMLEQKRFNPVFSKAWALFILKETGTFIGQQIVSIRGTAVEEVKREVKKTIAEGGDIVTDLSAAIQKVVNSNTFYLWQAERIARTETTTAMNAASQVAAEATGIIYEKQWLSAGDGNERPSHRDLNGQQVSMGQKFSNGLRYPGDPTGVASEVVNCRCTTLNIPISDNKNNITQAQNNVNVSYKGNKDLIERHKDLA
jgi:hypothetical protein